MSNDFNDDVRVDFDWDYLEPLSIYERGLVITAVAALNGEDAMPRLAAKAGIRQNTISRYVNGLTHLRFNTALKPIAFVRNERQRGRNAIATQTGRRI